jgi:DUF4097 and DUF4098 domain-containing protein YvlB
MFKKVKYMLLVLLLAFSSLSAADYEQKITKSFTLPANGKLELANVNGRIDVKSSKGDAVEIKALKSSSHKGEIEMVDVLFEQSGDTLKVKVKYNKRNSRVKVDFTVSVPEKLARAEIKSVNGEVDCSGRYANLQLATVNGRVTFAGEFRSAAFKTVNGAIDVSQEALLNGDLEAETVNGTLNIELNRKSAFSVEGRTVNGSIRSDFGVKVDKHFIGSSIEGPVNGGGKKVKVATVNGSIEISKI